VTR
jgi:hypothetical protein